MNLILAEYAAQHRMDETARDLDARHLLALTKAPVVRPTTIKVRLSRTVGWVRLARRGSAA